MRLEAGGKDGAKESHERRKDKRKELSESMDIPPETKRRRARPIPVSTLPQSKGSQNIPAGPMHWHWANLSRKNGSNWSQKDSSKMLDAAVDVLGEKNSRAN